MTDINEVAPSHGAAERPNNKGSAVYRTLADLDAFREAQERLVKQLGKSVKLVGLPERVSLVSRRETTKYFFAARKAGGICVPTIVDQLKEEISASDQSGYDCQTNNRYKIIETTQNNFAPTYVALKLDVDPRINGHRNKARRIIEEATGPIRWLDRPVYVPLATLINPDLKHEVEGIVMSDELALPLTEMLFDPEPKPPAQ